MVSQKLAKQFQKVLKEDYKKNVSLLEASQMLSGMVGYYDLLAKIHFQDLSTNDKEK